jgi:hypothetical protein
MACLTRFDPEAEQRSTVNKRCERSAREPEGVNPDSDSVTKRVSRTAITVSKRVFWLASRRALTSCAAGSDGEVEQTHRYQTVFTAASESEGVNPDSASVYKRVYRPAITVSKRLFRPGAPKIAYCLRGSSD